jgi:hypothetical protein
MATFNGVDYFGPVCTVKAIPAPRRLQINRYPGVNGLQAKDMGADGGEFVVEGWLIAPTPLDVGSLESDLFVAQQTGVLAYFVDNYGNQWPNCLLRMPEVDDRVYPCNGGFCRRYRVTILRLT